MAFDTDNLLKSLGVVLLAVLSLVQVSPIKIDPWTKLFEWIGNAMNKDIKEDLKSIHKEIDDMRHESDENEARRLRANILDFANSCRNHRKHTKDEFENIVRDYWDYMAIIERRKLKNGFVEAEYEYILEVFHHCQQENNFL